MKKLLITSLVFLSVNFCYSQNKSVQSKESDLFVELAAQLLTNLDYGNAYMKTFITRPYSSAGYMQIWKIKEKISEIPTKEDSRNLFLDYLYKRCEQYGEDYIIEGLVNMGMRIQDSKDLIEYVLTKHKLNMEKREKQ